MAPGGLLLAGNGVATLPSSRSFRTVAALLVVLLAMGPAAAQGAPVARVPGPDVVPEADSLPASPDPGETTTPDAAQPPAPDEEAVFSPVFHLSPLVGSLVIEERRDQQIGSVSRDNDRRIDDSQVRDWTPEKTRQGLQQKAVAITESPTDYRPGMAYPAGAGPLPEPDLGMDPEAGGRAKPTAAGRESSSGPLPATPSSSKPSQSSLLPARPGWDPIQDLPPQGQRQPSHRLSAQSVPAIVTSAPLAVGTTPAAILVATASAVLAACAFLYALLNKRELLKNGVRRKVFEEVRRNPGATMAQVARAIGVRHQTVAYHLNLLVKGGYLGESKSSSRNHYYASADGVPPEARRLAPIAHDAAAMQALAIIERDPGVPKTEVGLRMGFTRNAGVWHVRKLMEAGLVRSEKAKGFCRMYVVSERRAILDALVSS